MKFPEKYRSKHPLDLPHKRGDNFGWFMIPAFDHTGEVTLRVQAVQGDVWDHVSVYLESRCPTWDEMCMIKDLFFESEKTVVQYHPPKSEYVNVAKYCLHLWAYKGSMPRPPKIFV
jgi:hypothetical protein